MKKPKAEWDGAEIRNAYTKVIVIFYLFKVEFKSQSIFKWFYISADFSELIFKPWSIFTYGFFHNQSSFSHIFWNMIILYYFGKILNNLFRKSIETGSGSMAIISALGFNVLTSRANSP